MVKNIGLIKDTGNGKVFKRNSVLFFRLSAGVPGTEKLITDPKGNSITVYQKRVFSELSQPIYIKPKIKMFVDNTNNREVQVIVGHKTTIGK